MHVVMVALDGSKTTVAREFDQPLSFGIIAGGTWQESLATATWGYNTFLVVPWMSLEAWRLYQKKTFVYSRSEVLVGSDRHDATNSETFLRRREHVKKNIVPSVLYSMVVEKEKKNCVCAPSRKVKVDCTGVVLYFTVLYLGSRVLETGTNMFR